MKLSKEQFIEFLRANGGIYSRTAKAISEYLGEEYTRQQTRQRALVDLTPEELRDIKDSAIDTAEETMFLLLRSRNPVVAFQAAKFTLSTQGRDRGWGQKLEVSTPADEPIEVVIVDARTATKPNEG